MAKREMKSRAPRGTTVLTAMGATVVLVLIVSGVLAYTGAEQERSSRSVREIDAQDCAEAGAQFGRRFYGSNYDRWNTEFLVKGSLFSNPEETDPTKWGLYSYGRMDGLDVDKDHPADFRVTVSDNIDELPPDPDTADPYTDNDLQIIMRAECINKHLLSLAPGSTTVPAAATVQPDPNTWHGKTVLNETSQTRRSKVISVTLIHVPSGQYCEQLGGCTADGSQNLTQP